MQSGLTWHDWVIIVIAIAGYTLATCKFFLSLRDDVRSVKSDVQNVKTDQIEMKGHIKGFFERFESVRETLGRVDERMRIYPTQRVNHVKRDNDADGGR